MTTVFVKQVPTAAAVNSICLVQSPAQGQMLINGTLAAGGVVTLDAAHKIQIVCGGDNKLIVFTIIGTDADGNVQTERVNGDDGINVYSSKFYKTITSFTGSGGNVLNVSVGHTIESVSPTLKINTSLNPVNFNILAEVSSGTVTYGMDYTFDEAKRVNNYWIADNVITAKSASFESAWTKPISGLRLHVTASINAILLLKVVQAGV